MVQFYELVYQFFWPILIIGSILQTYAVIRIAKETEAKKNKNKTK